MAEYSQLMNCSELTNTIINKGQSVNMDKNDESCSMSQNESQAATCELRVDLPVEVFSRLSQLSVATGISVEQLVAQEVSRLLKADV